MEYESPAAVKVHPITNPAVQFTDLQNWEYFMAGGQVYMKVGIERYICLGRSATELYKGISWSVTRVTPLLIEVRIK